ncbi:MAG: Abi-alpha family protein [Thermodesulfobacteriota bacterium]|nr:Abi-alpha family protein [Thermodesulfobacteriota bacterium]
MEEELKKLIPKVYDDLAQPGVRRVGRTLAEAVNTALRPADGVLWTINQAFDWVSRAVERCLEHRKVAHDRVVSPSLLIEGRILQGLQLAGPDDDSQLRNMFAALLASAMDQESTSRVHPSFVTALQQILPDEARFFSAIAHHRVMVINASNLQRKWIRYGTWSYHFFDEVDLANVNNSNYWEFLASLKHLGLIDFTVPYHAEWEREAIHLPPVSRIFDLWRRFAIQHWHSKKGGSPGDEWYQEVHRMFDFKACRITQWGEDFADVCAAKEFYSGGRASAPEWAQ